MAFQQKMDFVVHYPKCGESGLSYEDKLAEVNFKKKN